MSSNGSIGFARLTYAIEVAFKALLDAVFGLANILTFASFACDAINEVIAVACDVVFAGIFFASCRACEPACAVQFWAVTAFFGYTFSLTRSVEDNRWWIGCWGYFGMNQNVP